MRLKNKIIISAASQAISNTTTLAFSNEGANIIASDESKFVIGGLHIIDRKRLLK